MIAVFPSTLNGTESDAAAMVLELIEGDKEM